MRIGRTSSALTAERAILRIESVASRSNRQRLPAQQGAKLGYFISRAFATRLALARASRCAFRSYKARLAEQGGDRHFAYGRIIRNGIEDRCDQLLEYASEAPRPGLVLVCQLSDLLEDPRIDGELDAFVVKDLAELAVDRMLRLDHYSHEHLPREILEPCDDRQTAREFRYQAVGEQIGRFHARVQ